MVAVCLAEVVGERELLDAEAPADVLLVSGARTRASGCERARARAGHNGQRQAQRAQRGLAAAHPRPSAAVRDGVDAVTMIGVTKPVADAVRVAVHEL
eukprot:7387113-Prymnesium_polylepis.1